jgi:hypothetical protein
MEVVSFGSAHWLPDRVIKEVSMPIVTGQP